MNVGEVFWQDRIAEPGGTRHYTSAQAGAPSQAGVKDQERRGSRLYVGGTHKRQAASWHINWRMNLR